MNVYCIEFPNGKKYVGVESNDGQRKQYHSKGHSHTVVGRAIAKHGWENCKFEYLVKNASRETCLFMEQKLIRVMNLQNKIYGYNVSAGGESGSLGVKRSPETIEKMKKARAGYVLTDSWKQAISKKLTGRKHSKERREQQSLSKGARLFDVVKNNIVVASYFNQSRCAEELGLSSKSINKCLKKKAKSHKGYVFIFRGLK